MASETPNAHDIISGSMPNLEGKAQARLGRLGIFQTRNLPKMRLAGLGRSAHAAVHGSICDPRCTSAAVMNSLRGAFWDGMLQTATHMPHSGGAMHALEPCRGSRVRFSTRSWG